MCIPVENGPGNLSGIPLQVMRPLGLGGQEFVSFPVSLHHSSTMARVDFEARKGAQFNLHCNF